MTRVMIWANQADLVTRFGEAELLRSAGIGTSDERNLDSERITAALTDAHAEISAQLATRYELPERSDLLTRLVCDIARYRLRNRSEAVKSGDGGVADVVRQRFEDASDLLARIANGKASLPGGVERQASRSNRTVYFENGHNPFSNGTALRGFKSTQRQL